MPVHFHMYGPLFRVRRCVCAEYIRTPRRRRRKSRPKTLSLPGRSRKSAGLPETLRDEADTRTYRADAGYSEAVVRPVPGPRAPAGEAESRKSGCKFAKTAGIFYF